MLKKPDDLLCSFIWSGFSTLQSLGSSRNDKPKASLSISNSFSLSWKVFKTYGWKVKKLLLNGIVIFFDKFSLAGCACDATKRCCIVDAISPFKAYSITWVFQLTKDTNQQCHLIYFNSIINCL